ncbi:MAG: hypothetical protein GY920_17725 [Aliivibrio sp.]|jgi:hypothetical protein|nr:hypothetical protein [Aliivibrio sp.]
MNVYTNNDSSFPSQVVSNEEKGTLEYGKQVAQAIEFEWFRQGRTNGNRYLTNWNNFHNLRLYARGEQSIQKYKDELSINGDLSYLNLDWKPVPILSKFVDIVVNGISQKSYDIKAYAQDPQSVKKRTEYASKLYEDMVAKDYIESVKQTLGIDLYQSPDPTTIPESKEELELKMQLSYKQSIEIAEEESISTVFAQNKYDLVRRRLNMDLTVLGIAAAKTSFNTAEGIKVDYVDPAYMVYSYSEDPNFEDIYYVGEVKAITIPELKKEFPNISEKELERIQNMPGNRSYITGWGDYDENTVQVMYFDYKTYHNQVFKIKQTDQGLMKAIEKPDTFNPPENDNFERVSRTIEVLYNGAVVLGTDTMLKWELAENMSRPYADTTKVAMNYAICAPRIYKGRIESVVSKCVGFADMIQITHLKLQQVLSRMVPDGVYLDMDGLAEVDLGNGTNYNPAEALNMYFQTGSIVGRSLTQDGELNHGKVPIQELNSSSGGGKIQSLITTYQYYLQMIRDVTGLNEARDGSTPDKSTLVGLQKLAANASNVATRHIVQSSLYLTLKLAENVSLKVADALRFPLTRASLQNSISTYNIKTLDEVVDLNLHDFGIFLELEPDEEERAQLEQNIQVALQSGGIDLEDAIDIRQIKNLKLANQMLKIKRKVKMERDQAAQQANIAAQADAQAQTAERTAMAEVQKQEAVASTKVDIEKAKQEMEMQKMQVAAQIKQAEMERQFQYDMQLKQMDIQVERNKEQFIEDRKDKRTKIQATQQSEMISQRKNDGLPIDFENQPDQGLGAFM